MQSEAILPASTVWSPLRTAPTAPAALLIRKNTHQPAALGGHTAAAKTHAAALHTLAGSIQSSSVLIKNFVTFY